MIFRYTRPSTQMAIKPALEYNFQASNRLRALFLPWPSGKGTCFLQRRARPLFTTAFTAGAQSCLNFSSGSSHTPSFSTTTSHGHINPDTGEGCPKIPWAVTVPYFQSPEYVSQTICPLSRQHLAVALRDEGSDRMRMPFFPEVSLSHWRGHCLTQSLYWA
jgi:hypothetical protein